MRESTRRRTTVALFTLASVFVSGPLLAQDESDDELAGALERIPPTEPEDAVRTFRVRDGFSLELVACEPEVIDPVDLAFDERGRMLVVEMRDYPFTLDEENLTRSEIARRQPSGRVRLLEDADGDGRAERSTVFLDGLSWPTAVACSGGGAYVAAAPDLLYARDLDGDGKADERRVVATGFGRRNVQALVNGLVWGPDRYLYILSGGNGGELRPPGDAPAPALSVRGRDLRFRPGGPLERIAHSGGQYGLSFDDWGHRFVCSNSEHVRQVVIDDGYLDRNPYLTGASSSATIAVDGGAAPVFRASPPEPWRVVRTRWRARSETASRYAPTELVPVGFFTSATGILIYRGEALGEEYRGSIFVGDVGGNLVHRKVLEDDGAAYRARRPGTGEMSEFIASADNWFRPVQLKEGPDGAIYILDMYRETIEHPYSIPDRIKRHLDLTSGNDRGRIYRLVRTGSARRAPVLPAGLPARDLPRLAGGGDGAWVRSTAARLLLERAASKGDENGERGGDGDGGGSAADGGGIVAASLRTVAREGSDPAGRVESLWTLEALGSLGDEELIAALRDPHPGVRENGLRIAERLLRPGPSAVLDAVLALAGDPSPRVRLQAALTIGGLETERAAEALARILSRDAPDAWTRTAVLAAAPVHAPRLLEALARDRSFRPSAAGEILRRLASIACAAEGERAVPAVAAALAALGPAAPGLRADVLSGAGEGLERRGTSLRKVLAGGPADLTDAARILASLFSRAQRDAGNRELSIDERRRAIRLLAEDRSAAGAEALARLLDAGEAPEIQLAAVRALGAHEGCAERLLYAWVRLSPRVRGEVLEVLFRRRERLPPLLAAVRRGDIAPAEIEPARRKQLLDHPDGGVRAAARDVLGEAPARPRDQVVRSYRSALRIEGDPARGRELATTACLTCHRAGGAGHQVAPDLETVRDRSPEDLLLHILDPNREVSPVYIAYAAVTGDGQTFSGIIASETEGSVTLRRAEGAEDTILRRQIVELRSTGMSLMPEDLEKTLDSRDLADIIAFVRSLEGDRRP